MDLPCVIDECVLDVPLKFRIRNGCRICGHEEISQQEFGECIAVCAGSRVPRGKGLECKHTARKLVPELVEVLAVVLKPEGESVFPMDPGELVENLERIVVIGEWTVVGIADGVGCIFSIEYNVWNSPSDRGTRGLVRNADVRNCVQDTRAQG